MKSGIYKINFNNGSYFYIGSAVNLNKRKSVHLHNLKNEKHCNKKMQNIYNKYNDFDFKILELVEVNSLIEKEQFYIDTLKPNINILKKANSSLGYKHNEDTIIKLKKIAKQKTNDKEFLKKISKTWFVKGQKIKHSKESIEKRVKSFTGYKHTVEAKKKMSEKAKQRDYSKIDISKFIQSGINASKKPVKQIKEDGSFVFQESITDAIKQYNIKQTRHLKNAILKNKKYKNSYWEFVNNSL